MAIVVTITSSNFSTIIDQGTIRKIEEKLLIAVGMKTPASACNGGSSEMDHL